MKHVYLNWIILFQALIGIAFSIGFVFGPSIGAMFSLMDKDSEKFYILPAIFCIVLAVADILFLYAFLPETLPQKIRVGKGSVFVWKSVCVCVCVCVWLVFSHIITVAFCFSSCVIMCSFLKI